MALHSWQGWANLCLKALRDQSLEVFTRALRDKGGSSVTGISSGAGVLSDRALHTERFGSLSVPCRLRCSSAGETIVVSALNRRALHLEIGEALNLELPCALNLELRGRDWVRLERAWEASQ